MTNQTLKNSGSDLNVGIIGAGAIGQAMAKQLVRAGVNVTLSNSRGPASLAKIVGQLGAKARAGNWSTIGQRNDCARKSKRKPTTSLGKPPVCCTAARSRSIICATSKACATTPSICWAAD